MKQNQDHPVVNTFANTLMIARMITGAILGVLIIGRFLGLW